MKRFLFICSQNKLRSPTAENVFREYQGLEVQSAGLNKDAVTPLTPDDILWADYIFIIETSHRNKLFKRYKSYIKNQRVIVLNIPDKYDFWILFLLLN